VRNEVGLDVSHHARISQRGGEMPFFLDILFHRMSVMAIFQQPPIFLCKTDRFVSEDCFIVDQP
jgi:hypothetical protein